MNASGSSFASEIRFQPLHPVRSWINRVASETVFQPFSQTPALVALLFLVFQRNVPVGSIVAK